MTVAAIAEPVAAATRALPESADVQARAEAMMDRHGFLGVQRWNFGLGGSERFALLREQGLRETSKVLDIGCGVLRVAAWLVPFLEPGGYCGIEPARERVAHGREAFFDAATWSAQRPRFDHNADFDTAVFGERFDVFFACSIWTHASKGQIATMLDGFVRDTAPDAVFLTSYFPASSNADDYDGTTWVGTSHESTTPGIVRHRLEWIRARCAERELALTELPGRDTDDQSWLRIERRQPDRRAEHYGWSNEVRS